MERVRPDVRLQGILTDEERRIGHAAIEPYLGIALDPEELADILLDEVMKRRWANPDGFQTDNTTSRDVIGQIKTTTRRPWLRRVKNEVAALSVVLPLTAGTILYSVDTVPKLIDIENSNKAALCTTLIEASKAKNQIEVVDPRKDQTACLRMIERYDSIAEDNNPLVMPKEKAARLGLVFGSLSLFGLSGYRLWNFGNLPIQGFRNFKSNRRKSTLPI